MKQITLFSAICLLVISLTVDAQYTRKWDFNSGTGHQFALGSANLDDDPNMEVVIETTNDTYTNIVYHILDAVTGAEDGTVGPFYDAQLSYVQVNSSGKSGLLISHKSADGQPVFFSLYVKGSIGGFTDMSNNQPEITNFPNPFSNSTTLSYEVTEKCQVTITLYNLQGNVIRTLVNEEKTPGKYMALIDGANLPAGEYFYQAVIGEKKGTKQVIHIN